jgi:hypothetical protein
MKKVTAGSYSRLGQFEKCKFSTKLKVIDRIPEPDRGPPPKHLKEWPNDRGTRIHDHAEGFVIGNHDAMIPEMRHFADEFNHLRELFQAGLVVPEQLWCFDEDWLPCDGQDYDKIRFRVKTDATVFYNADRLKAVVIDYKSGRRKGNEMAHEMQKQLYAIGAFLTFPELEYVLTELFYLDLPDEPTYPTGYTRVQAMALLKRSWGPRNEKLLTEVVFKPSPSAFACKWCPYNLRNGSKECEYAVI